MLEVGPWLYKKQWMSRSDGVELMWVYVVNSSNNGVLKLPGLDVVA